MEPIYTSTKDDDGDDDNNNGFDRARVDGDIVER